MSLYVSDFPVWVPVYANEFPNVCVCAPHICNALACPSPLGYGGIHMALPDSDEYSRQHAPLPSPGTGELCILRPCMYPNVCLVCTVAFPPLAQKWTGGLHDSMHLHYYYSSSDSAGLVRAKLTVLHAYIHGRLKWSRTCLQLIFSCFALTVKFPVLRPDCKQGRRQHLDAPC